MPSTLMNTTRDQKFILKEYLNLQTILDTERFKGGYSVDDVDFILENALKGAKEVVAPSNEDAEKFGCVFENGKVTVSQSLKDAYNFICENGFASTNYDPHDESAMPMPVLWALYEYFIAANPSIQTLYLGTNGAVGLIDDFGSAELQKTYLPKMYSGKWNGTMCLTEPQAGSDVGASTAKAVPTGNPGEYIIKGTKQFISGGEQNITENIIHLVLARTEGAGSGTKGLSLFVVPKFIPDANNNPGEFNDVTCVGVEHKMGHKGSATCVMSFGDEGKCKGYILGDPPGEDGVGKGMSQMFRMMNEERLMSGASGLSVAASAYHNAVQYATDRIQGRSTVNPKAGKCAIIKHEDIKRMLMFQKSNIEAFRAMVLQTFWWVDVEKWSADPELKKQARVYLEVNTPIIKAFCSDTAIQCISEALQIYGGYGFCEDYSAAQQCRDARIYSIWEGTNYIQAMDLVGRKMTMKKGEVFGAWMKDITDFVAANKNAAGFETEMALFEEGVKNYNEAFNVLLKLFATPGMAQFFATRVLHATGKIWAGKLLLEMALIAQEKLKGLNEDHFDYAFYAGKVASARFYIKNIMPDMFAYLQACKNADTTVLDVDERIFYV